MLKQFQHLTGSLLCVLCANKPSKVIYKRMAHYIGYSVIVALTGLPIGYSVIVALTGLPIGYSVILALTGLPIEYSVIVAQTGLPMGYITWHTAQ